MRSRRCRSSRGGASELAGHRWAASRLMSPGTARKAANCRSRAGHRVAPRCRTSCAALLRHMRTTTRPGALIQISVQDDTNARIFLSTRYLGGIDMARPRRVDPELVTQAQAAVRDADNVEALRCAQAVLLPALLGATLEQTAAVLGIGRATVPRLQARLRRLLAKPDAIQPNWGGRRRASNPLNLAHSHTAGL